MRKILPGFILLLLFLAACGAKPPTPATVAWLVEVAGVEVKDSLSSVESVTQYEGNNIDVEHAQKPADGNVYVIINATVSKRDNASTASFDWSKLTLEDEAGKIYNRLPNDTFLEQYGYSPRLTGLELRFGEYSGWMCFEIPAAAAEGKLVLAYTTENTRQEITLPK